jgi:hypothetical protein
MAVTTVKGIMGKTAELITQSGVTSYKVKRKCPGKYENVEKKLLVWFKQSVALNIPINSTLVKEKAVEIADRLGVDFTPSNGWLDTKIELGWCIKLSVEKQGVLIYLK